MASAAETVANASELLNRPATGAPHRWRSVNTHCVDRAYGINAEAIARCCATSG
jgi:hypothetical protein